jgi:hypothetical protein
MIDYFRDTAFSFIIYIFCLATMGGIINPLRLAPDHMTIKGRNLNNGEGISQGETSQSIEQSFGLDTLLRASLLVCPENTGRLERPLLK